MAVDMATLKATTLGDQTTKLTVKRSWLTEVYRLLREREDLLAEVQMLKDRAERQDKILRNMPRDDQDWDGGMGGMFGNLFGRGKH